MRSITPAELGSHGPRRGSFVSSAMTPSRCRVMIDQLELPVKSRDNGWISEGDSLCQAETISSIPYFVPGTGSIARSSIGFASGGATADGVSVRWSGWAERARRRLPSGF